MSDGPQPLDPRVRTLWHLLWGAGMSPVVLAAAVVAALAAADGEPVVAAALALVAVAAVGIAATVPRLRYARWRWQLTEAGLEVSHGVIHRVESSIPAFRVQQIDLRQGPVERRFGLVQLQISTASAGSDGVLPGLDAARAEAVRQQLLDRVVVDDGV